MNVKANETDHAKHYKEAIRCAIIKVKQQIMRDMVKRNLEFANELVKRYDK